MSDSVKPYKESSASKKEQVAQMFDNISHRYDFLNHFLSLGIDKLWRKKAVKLIRDSSPKQILDVATGTADFAIETLSCKPTNVIGVDISEGMLEKGRQKIKRKGLGDVIQLKYGDSENLPFEDDSFDAIIVGFGVRNFENLELGLNEMRRVLKKNGQVAILELSKPKKFPIKQLYLFYFKLILPVIGRLFSKDTSAYTYLPDSVNAFPEGDKFVSMLSDVGYNNVKSKLLSGGIATIYSAFK
tara:strand:+ start:824 stop:1552 length:729 start_codon:yes stop_codon:yes gene_type:complete